MKLVTFCVAGTENAKLGAVAGDGVIVDLHHAAERRDGRLDFADLHGLSYISRDETLFPGDFIGAGTLPGGCGLELDRWLEPGDVVELKSAELGVLRNRVVRAESPAV